MIVMKFGGTSLRDAEAMRSAAAIVERALPRRPLVLVSACAGVTNGLLRSAGLALEGELGAAHEAAEELQARHLGIAEALKLDSAVTWRNLGQLFKQLRAELLRTRLEVVEGRRLTDAILGLGEQASSILLHGLLLRRGLDAALLDAREIIVTDEAHTRAAPQPVEIAARVRERLRPALESHQVVITQGFIGATRDGVPTTIGRGGSDWSATLMAAALPAQEIEIWTDTDGMLSCDPALIPRARPIASISFAEAAEMAHFGAKVLHPDTIDPARLAGIPLRVLNSARPDRTGTAIGYEADETQQECATPKGIAFRDGQSIVSLRTTRLTPPYEFLSRAFGVLARFRKSVGLLTTSSSGLSFTVEDEEELAEIVAALDDFAVARIQRDKAIIAVVGRFHRRSDAVAARVFSALSELKIRVDLVSYGGAEINLALVVDSCQLTRAVSVIHAEFFEQEQNLVPLARLASGA